MIGDTRVTEVTGGNLLYRHLRIQYHTLFSILCLVSLGGCYAPVVQQLEAIPLPAAAQLTSLPPPKCLAAQTIDEATEEPPVAEKTDQGDGSEGMQPSADSERDLKRELDCFRHAEQAARDRLARLQASTVGTRAALEEMKRRYTPPGVPGARAGRETR